MHGGIGFVASWKRRKKLSKTTYFAAKERTLMPVLSRKAGKADSFPARNAGRLAVTQRARWAIEIGPNKACAYYGITEEKIHALVRDVAHGTHAAIQDLKCQGVGARD
jgi:hypothetical protein